MHSFLYRFVRSLLIAGLLITTLTAPAKANEQTILILGDSISAAYGMSLEQGWVAQFAQYLQENKLPYNVVNASISGETTAGGLRRLPLLLTQHQPALVVIELGGNDGLRGFPLNTLKTNLQRIVTLAQQAKADVILVPMEIPPNYGARYTEGFRNAFTAVAAQSNAVLAPFILDNIAINPALMQEDGIHPTAAAQTLLLANMLPTITEAITK